MGYNDDIKKAEVYKNNIFMIKLSSWSVRAAGAVAAVGFLLTVGVAYATVPTLSQSSVTVGLGQSATVTAQNGVSIYMNGNSNSSVATVSQSGAQIIVTGQTLGSTNVTVCATGTSSDCASFSVTVQTASVSGISFNPSSVSLSVGNSQSVTVSGGNGTYTVSNNSNASVASTNLSGSALSVSALAVGGATINVCDTSGVCSALSVTVNASGASGLSFSQNNFSLATGAGQPVTVSGGNGNYTVSNNSNTSVVSTSVSGSTVTVSALSAGSATINVCDTSGVCGVLSVSATVPIGSQGVTFNPTNPTLAVGQTVSVSLSGGSTYVVLSNLSPGVAQTNMVNGLTLSLTGVSAGTDTLGICVTAGNCSPLTVTVTGPATSVAATTTTQTAAVVTTPTVVTTPAAQPAAVVANLALLAEIQTLQTAVTQVLSQIQSIQTQLNQLQAQVNAGSGSGITTNVNAAVTVSSGASAGFTELLTVGSQNAQVTALQQKLAALGFYTGSVTGYYGSATEQAVKKYQTAHGISMTGSVGPATRTALNAGN